MPIVDRVLRHGGGKGVQAIVVYPMNALANSQLGELEKFLGKQAPKVTYQRYTGQEDRKTREGILANPPDVLLTNYVMLKLLLTRPNERKALIESAKNLRFLVLDELRSTEAGRAPTSPCSSGGCAAPSEPTSRCSASERPQRSPDRGPRLRSALRLRTLPPACSGRPSTRTTSWGRPLKRATSGETNPAELRALVSQEPPISRSALETDPLAIWIELFPRIVLRRRRHAPKVRRTQGPKRVASSRLPCPSWRVSESSSGIIVNCA